MWQKVRADSENPATIESSWTQVLPGLILQFGCFQLNVKQLWPFICSSRWNPSKGKLSPISSFSQPQACRSVFWRQRGAGTASWQNSTKKELSFLISGQSNETLIQPLIFQCLYLGTRMTASKIRGKYERCWRLSRRVRTLPSGNKMNKLSQCENKFSSVYGIVLHDE